MSQFFKHTFYLIWITLVISSCKEEITRSFESRPLALGRINDVVILCDKQTFEGPVGDTVSWYFESAYPVLPAEEPIFDIRHMSPEDLAARPLKREMRTFVLVADVSDTASATTKMLREDLGQEKYDKAVTDPSFTSLVGQDKWARDQMIIYIFANGTEKLARAIRDNFPSIAKRINQHDLKNLTATVYGIKEQNFELSKLVLDSFGMQLRVPGLYKKAIQKPNFLWLRLDDKEMNQSIVIRRFPYTDKSQFTKDSIIRLRNEYGREFIHSGFADAYMTTNTEDLPAYEYTYTQNGVYVREVRGIWEMENDFMGGPFISYLLLNEAAGEVIFIDAFVFAPGKEKRDYVQQLDCIVKTAKFPGVVRK